MAFANIICFIVLIIGAVLIVWGLFCIFSSVRLINYVVSNVLDRERGYQPPSSLRHIRPRSFKYEDARPLRDDGLARRHYALLAMCLGSIPILAGTILLSCLVLAVAPAERRATALPEPAKVLSTTSAPANLAFQNAYDAAGPNGAYLLAYTAGIMRQRELDKKPQPSASELALLLNPLADIGVASVENISTFSRELLLELGKAGIGVVKDVTSEGLKSFINMKPKVENVAAPVPICNVTVNVPAEVIPQSPAKPGKEASPQKPKEHKGPREPSKPKVRSSCEVMTYQPGRSDSPPPL